MSNVTDHANSEQHKSAMIYLHKDQAKSRNEPINSFVYTLHKYNHMYICSVATIIMSGQHSVMADQVAL